MWSTRLSVGLGDASVNEDLRHWLNEGLMALFFLVVGLEIKRELAAGELRSWRTAALPAFAALGGMVLPAALYTAVTWVRREPAAGASPWPPTSPSPSAFWPSWVRASTPRCGCSS
ncbi:MAG TPA: Na+/H+ antiporter NhaA [Acidimicrobiales bacterium]|nr:Na+/H+ antiporter NhaA [Acidimicrobiales bacterium]